MKNLTEVFLEENSKLLVMLAEKLGKLGDYETSLIRLEGSIENYGRSIKVHYEATLAEGLSIEMVAAHSRNIETAQAQVKSWELEKGMILSLLTLNNDAKKERKDIISNQYELEEKMRLSELDAEEKRRDHEREMKIIDHEIARENRLAAEAAAKVAATAQEQASQSIDSLLKGLQGNGDS